MQIKTIETIAGINKIDFRSNDHNITAHYYWLKNLSDSTLYVSAEPNPIIGADDVAELPAKGAVSIETDEGIIYILGAGKVEIHRTDSKIRPFELVSTGSGGSIENTKFTTYALRDAGYDVSDDPSTWDETVKAKFMLYDYRLDYSGMIFKYGNKKVTRSTNELAYCGWTTFISGITGEAGYFQPMCISVYPEAVKMSMNGNPSENFETTIDGRTIYWSRCWNGSERYGDSSGYNRRYLGVGANVDTVKKLYDEITLLGYSLYE